jgi:tetratricopeptide (TPR) repeat protein
MHSASAYSPTSIAECSVATSGGQSETGCRCRSELSTKWKLQMPKGRDAGKPRGVQRVAIDGHFLDEVQTRLETGRTGTSVTYTSAPVERHQAIEDEEGVTLKLPILTALQMYCDGILSADPSKSLTLSIAGRKPATVFLQWLRGLPGDEFGNPVLLRFGPQPAKQQKPAKPNAWLKNLLPLKLRKQGEWDPAEEYWGEAGEAIEAWAKPIIKRGPRPMYEMEQILPGADPEDFDSDPILEANELKDRGQIARAKKLLERLLVKDVRCLDAHAHLGNIAFDTDARTALDHYQRGVLIGELSLGEKFAGVLPWGMIDNRPFLRCLSGFGLCLWRLERFEEAQAVFDRLLWMSPSDNLGIRLLLPNVQARKPWTSDDP